MCIPLLYCDNFSTLVHNHANCPRRMHSERYDFVITHQLHCVIAFGSLSSNFRSCFCGPAFSFSFSGPAFSVHPTRSVITGNVRQFSWIAICTSAYNGAQFIYLTMTGNKICSCIVILLSRTCVSVKAMLYNVRSNCICKLLDSFMLNPTCGDLTPSPTSRSYSFPWQHRKRRDEDVLKWRCRRLMPLNIILRRTHLHFA